jgi:hypothetical protein
MTLFGVLLSISVSVFLVSVTLVFCNICHLNDIAEGRELIDSPKHMRCPKFVLTLAIAAFGIWISIIVSIFLLLLRFLKIM